LNGLNRNDRFINFKCVKLVTVGKTTDGSGAKWLEAST
jgi:hypothetical protein